MLNGISVNVLDFGADNTGVSDASPAIRLAIAKAAALSTSIVDSGTGMTYSNLPNVFFPAGKYKISTALTANTTNSVSWINFKGENSFLLADAGVIVFGGVGPQVLFEDLQFIGGASHISVKTGNLDTATIRINHCSFYTWSGNCIAVDATSNSTLLTVKNSRFVSSYTADDSQVLHSISCDSIVFEDCWVSHRNTNGPAFYSAGAILQLRNIFGIPIINLKTWVEHRGATCLIEGCRFGGEFEVFSIVDNYSAAALQILNSQCYTTHQIVKFYDIPSNYILSGCTGFTDTKAYYFDYAAIPDASLANIGSLDSLFLIENNTPNNISYLFANEVSELQGLHFARDAVKSSLSSPCDLAAVILNLAGYTNAYGVAFSNTATLSTTATDRYGTFACLYSGTAGQTITHDYTTLLTGLPAGVYTAMVGVSVVGQVFGVQVIVANSNYRFFVGPGDFTLNIPFYFDGVSPTRLLWDGSLPATGTTIQFNRVTIYSGQRTYSNQISILEGAAAPTTGTWHIGDSMTRTPPVVGQPTGWVCTVAGVPGTWVALANL
jgi:hypothetical protein